MICGFLLAAGSVSAITPEERAIIVIPQRAVKLLLEAESRAMERCDTTRIVVSLPIVNMDTRVMTSRGWMEHMRRLSRLSGAALVWKASVRGKVF